MQYDELKEHIKQAMKAHDKVRLSILRQVHGEIKNIEVNERRDITEQDVDDMTKSCFPNSWPASSFPRSSMPCCPRRARPRRRRWGVSWVSSPSAPAATSTRPLPRRSCKASLPNEAPVSE